MHIAPLDFILWHVWFRVVNTKPRFWWWTTSKYCGTCFSCPYSNWCSLLVKYFCVSLLLLGPAHVSRAASGLTSESMVTLIVNHYLWLCWRFLLSYRFLDRGFASYLSKVVDFYTWTNRDYPLNLSISVNGGKENNSDSRSNCEWTGISPALNRSALWYCEV